MFGCLASIQPLDVVTGNRVEVRVSTFGKRDGAAANGLNSQVWEPSVIKRPTIGISLWNGDFVAAISPAAATLPINLAVLANTWPNIGRYVWMGAPITIYAGEAGDSWPWPVLFAGRVKSYAGSGSRTTLQAEVDFEPFNVQMPNSLYAGTGGAEGGADLKNQPKPLIVGWAMNVEPKLIDADNDVWQFSGYGAIEAVSVLYERGSDFGASQGDFASYAALVAADLSGGQWATCLAEGMVRLGAPAAGVITGDVKGHKVGATTPRLTGAIINALVTLAGISTARIETATLSALDVDKPYPVNIVLTERESFLDIASDMVLKANWQAGVSLAGKFFVADVDLAGSSVITFDAQGKASPQVVEADETDVSPPYWKTVLGANRCWRTHTTDEIAFYADLVERGLYSDTEVYREGNIVSLEDGSRWVYINATAGSGNPPPDWPTTSNAYWENLTPPLAIGSALLGYLTNPAHTVYANSAGVVSDFTGAGGQFIVSYGGTILTADVAYSVVSETGVDVSINPTTGVYTVNSMSASDGTATFRATYDGETVDQVYSIAKSIQGIDGDDGSDAVAVVLSNEFQGIPTNQDGSGGDFSGATGTVKVFNHTGDITAAATIGAATAVGCSGSVNTAANTPVSGQPKGYYRVTSMSADQAYLDIPVTVGLITVIKRFSLSKNKTGAGITLVADRQTITYDGNGAANPSTQTVTLTATLVNTTSGVSNWYVASMTGTFQLVTSQISVAGNTLSATMTRAQFEAIAGSTRGVRVKIDKYVGGPYIEDVVTITKVQAGADGVDGQDAKAMQIWQTRYGITYDANGNLSPASQTTQFLAEKINTTANIVWQVKDANGVNRTPLATYLTVAGDTNSATQTAAQFEAARNGTKGVFIYATLTDGSTVLNDSASQVQVPQGAAAIGFVQDSPTPTAQFVNQTWYKPTAKEWYRWSGSAWVRILGDLSAIDSVSWDYIDDDAINTAGYVKQTALLTIGAGGSTVQTFLGSTWMVEGGEALVTVIIPYIIEVNNPVMGTEYSLTIEAVIRRVATGTNIYSDAFPVSDVWNAASTSGAQKFGKRTVTVEHRFTGLVDGFYEIGYRLTGQSPAAASFPSPRYCKGNNTRAMQ